MKLKEIWKQMDSFPYYEVSNTGKIRSIARTVMLPNGTNRSYPQKLKTIRKHSRSGFLMTDVLNHEGKRVTAYLHKWVAQCFIPNPTPRKRKVVIHLDGNYENNNVKNLIWASYEESIQHRYKNDGYRESKIKRNQGRRPPLNEEQEKEAVYLRKVKKLTLQAIGFKLGCSASYVLKVIKKREG